METAKLKKFAQFARRSLIEQVSAKLKLVLAENSAARRENAGTLTKLDEAIQKLGKDQVVERVAYIWFNRFCALRFMDVNRYNRVNIVSPADPGQFQPEILAEAKMGHIDEEMVQEKTRQQIVALLDGKAPSRDPQGEAYRLLVVGACNNWNRAMPFLFERIDDYTELLMPDDLLSGNSILAYTREAMTPDVCGVFSNQPSVISNQEQNTDGWKLRADSSAAAGGVEVIGWLYQFYISEKKDEVFEGLKKNKKITPENIPAATQLFTPHWIVRYLVENSLGRLWMLNRPNSRLVERMDYYIAPAQAETDFLRIGKPEEIKICDPACGSGHMLTYAFDLLHAIYEEEGVDPAEIPEKILTRNLFGIEIDERAGELAAFALTMKARAKQRRFFRKQVLPNICVLENVQFDEGELKSYMDFVGRNLFTVGLQTTLRQFEEADNFGSLIRPELTDVEGMLKTLEAKNPAGHLFLSLTHQKVLQVLRQADFLSPKYHVVIANPPYMGSKGMNGRLGAWAKDKFPDSKTDLFAMFIERNLCLSVACGYSAMITIQNWMFLSSYEILRTHLCKNAEISALLQIGYNSFPELNSKVALGSAFILRNSTPIHPGIFINLNDAPQAADKNKIFFDRKVAQKYYQVATSDFIEISGTPIAYWLSNKLKDAFRRGSPLSQVADPRKGITTADNEKYLRAWQEVSLNKFSGDANQAKNLAGARWFPINKGGNYRKWYGNKEQAILWENDGDGLKKFERSVVRNPGYYFKEGMTWNDISSGKMSMRYSSDDAMFEGKGPMAFASNRALLYGLIAIFNSEVSTAVMNILCPTLNFNIGDVARFPIIGNAATNIKAQKNTEKNIYWAKSDWDSYETSWAFTILPLLQTDYQHLTLDATYQKLRSHWQEMTLEMQRLEEENNRIFIEVYGLRDELTPEVPLSEITLTCNPHYRYGGDKNAEELEALLLADTMRELISYAVGCMFGRYALEKPGLILANQGDTLADYLKLVPEPSFPADDDNVIPMLDGDWFPDDIAERFHKFLRVAFGEEHYEANLQFIEKALGKNGKARDIRDYFLKDFYSDHVKRYKKRPIYWLFSSPKGSFNALIYMHRYRPDTVSVVLNDYLREFRTKLTSHKNHLEAVSISASSTQGEKTKALKEIEKVNKMISEMEEYEREVLYPLATEQVEIDLDNGVKVNYPRLGAALKKIPGLDAVEES